MGGGISVSKNERIQLRHAAADQFRRIHDWYVSREAKGSSEGDLADMLEDAMENIFGDVQLESPKKMSIQKDKNNFVQSGVSFSNQVAVVHSNTSNTIENFMDSTYIGQWLSQDDADELFHHLRDIGERDRPQTSVKGDLKYPLWSLYYGFKREIDNARALDRWGSHHESWIRVLEPTDLIAKYCLRIRDDFKLPHYAVNSIVVNYYFDGDATFIPAHRDTTACLEEGSSIFCLSLGASRDFLLTSNDDSGKHLKEAMTVEREWRVNHGDLFALGQETNTSFCHAVPQEKQVSKLRISVIFRSISKSFIDLDSSEKSVEYASGNIHKYKAECIKTSTYNDPGIREHISDLIASREIKKLAKRVISKVNNSLFSEVDEDRRMFYMGYGSAVPTIDNSKS